MSSWLGSIFGWLGRNFGLVGKDVGLVGEDVKLVGKDVRWLGMIYSLVGEDVRSHVEEGISCDLGLRVKFGRVESVFVNSA